MKRAHSLLFGTLLLAACHGEPPRIIAEGMRGEVVKNEADEIAIRTKREGSISIEEWKKKNECELGSLRSCGGGSPFADGRPLMMRCILWADGTQHYSRASCNTPLAIAWEDRPVTFTSVATSFPIGTATRTDWIGADTPWLALDRDGSGCIESSAELFAGFAPLAVYDENQDGKIDANDPVFSKLVLWSDQNQDKRCESSELTSLATAGITEIDLRFVDHEPTSFGSYEGETAAVTSTKKARIVDVHLLPF